MNVIHFLAAALARFPAPGGLLRRVRHPKRPSLAAAAARKGPGGGAASLRIARRGARLGGREAHRQHRARMLMAPLPAVLLTVFGGFPSGC